MTIVRRPNETVITYACGCAARFLRMGAHWDAQYTVCRGHKH